MVKSYADDPSKASVRERLGNFIRQTVMKYKKPKDISVVCLPGAEALEVYEVYDQLGIPRRNVLGLERDSQNYVALQNPNLGMRLTERPLNALDYFGTTPLKFDIISLDYTSQQGKDELRTLRLIAGRQILSHRGILYTNYTGKRESKNQQFLLSFNVLEQEHKSELPQPHLPSLSLTDTLSVFVEMSKHGIEVASKKAKELTDKLASGSLELSRYRDRGITYHIIKTFERGRRNLVLLPIFQISQVTDSIRDSLQRASEIYQEMYNSLEESGILELASILENPGYTDEGYVLYSFYLQDYLSHLLNSVGLPETAAPFFSEFVISKSARPYYLMNSERYYYTSNTGAPMLSDLLFFDQKESFFQRMSDIIDVDFSGEQPRFALNRRRLNPRKFARLFNEGINTIEELWAHYVRKLDNMPARIRIATSNSVEDTKKQELSKEDAISLLQDSIPTAEILEAFPESFTKRQLAALKAHITMGTYKK